jgi:hypothetical protein
VIPAGGNLYVTPNLKAFRMRKVSPTGGETNFVVGGYDGHLSSWGETVDLLAADDALIDTFSYTADPSDTQWYLRVSEIMYHPERPEGVTAFENEDFEYIELRNIGSQTLDIGGVKFVDGLDHEINAPLMPNSLEMKLEPYQSIVLCKNVDAFSSVYDTNGIFVAPVSYNGRFSNSGEKIRLVDASGSKIQEFTYNDGWYELTDGMGFSLTMIDPGATDLDAWNDKLSWRASLHKGGTPGRD